MKRVPHTFICFTMGANIYHQLWYSLIPVNRSGVNYKMPTISMLTHRGRGTHIWKCITRIVIWTAPSHYLNHCWNIVNWTLGNKLQWNFNRNSNIFIQENALENVVCKMASICLGLNVSNILALALACWPILAPMMDPSLHLQMT